MRIKKSDFKNKLASLKEFFASHKTLFFVLLIIIPLAYIGAIFYFYAWYVKTPVELPTKTISIDSVLYQKTMDDLNQREINFAQEEAKTYSDPFYR